MIRHWQTVWLESLFEIRRYFLSYPFLWYIYLQMIFSLSFPRCPERRLEQNTSTQFLTVHLQGLKTTCGPLRLTLGRINFGVGGGETKGIIYYEKNVFFNKGPHQRSNNRERLRSWHSVYSSSVFRNQFLWHCFTHGKCIVYGSRRQCYVPRGWFPGKIARREVSGY